MKILIIGSGGREHALAWKISQSPNCSELFVAPGNAGTNAIAKNISLKVDDLNSVTAFIVEHDIRMVVIGPEAPLVDGLADALTSDDRLKDLMVVGPSKKGAMLEGSKDFAKQFMNRHGIPTAGSQTFARDQIDEAIEYQSTLPLPIVLKADGLAAGKGVIICHSHDKAKETLKAMLVDEQFGSASDAVIIEEFLDGIELSVFVLTDGKNYLLLPEAKDYKPIGENNTGPNTGGMGSVSPVNFAQGAFMNKVEQRIIIPTIEGIRKDELPYSGFVFFGLMNVKGEPYVIEYNVRMGDPEAQVVLPRIKNDFVALMESTARGTLHKVQLELDTRTTTTVIMASGGYPESYEKGHPIAGLETADNDTVVFHAGTKIAGDEVVTNGGRVLAVSGFGDNLKQALDASYKRVRTISWKDVYYRKDIGQDLLTFDLNT